MAEAREKAGAPLVAGHQLADDSSVRHRDPIHRALGVGASYQSNSAIGGALERHGGIEVVLEEGAGFLGIGHGWELGAREGKQLEVVGGDGAIGVVGEEEALVAGGGKVVEHGGDKGVGEGGDLDKDVSGGGENRSGPRCHRWCSIC